MSAQSDLAAELQTHERLLRGLCYRMTGSAADADDLVQDTFLRALERPPARTAEPWRPWLVAVAMNLSRDALRRRKRRAYEGPWLPSPIETEGESEPASLEIHGTEGRYDLLESVSYAFLLALEALSPQQRAVLLLRDVFDYSVKETAEALALSEPNVKTTHHRARKALEPYEADRCRPTAVLAARTEEALMRFLAGLTAHDVAGVEALLAEGVKAVSDGGGVYLAARKILVGPERVAKLYLGLTRNGVAPTKWAIRSINGLPALVAEVEPASEREAPRYVLRCDVDAAGRIIAIHSVLAPQKLTAVRPV